MGAVVVGVVDDMVHNILHRIDKRLPFAIGILNQLIKGKVGQQGTALVGILLIHIEQILARYISPDSKQWELPEYPLIPYVMGRQDVIQEAVEWGRVGPCTGVELANDPLIHEAVVCQ